MTGFWIVLIIALVGLVLLVACDYIKPLGYWFDKNVEKFDDDTMISLYGKK